MFQRLMDQVLSGLQRNDMFIIMTILLFMLSDIRPSLAEYQIKFNKFAERL